MMMFLSAVLALGIIADPDSRKTDYPRAELLVEPAELAKTATKKSVVILDARAKSKYEASHIPGARWVNHEEWAKSFGDGRDTAAWSRRIGELGIAGDTPVIVYDDNLAKDAARIWWILRYWGVQNPQLLNGGWLGWTQAKLPTEKEVAPHSPVKFQAMPFAERYATKDQLLLSLAGQTLQIVDARSEAEHCGTETLSNSRAGAIPGAMQLEWSDLLDAKTHRFKPAEELKALFTKAGIELDRPTATHCQSGGRAAVMAFGLELMGAKDVKNYYSSWQEWGNAKDTPVVKPVKK